MKRFTLSNSSAFEFCSALDTNSIDAVISDAPFGILDEDWDRSGSNATLELIPVLYRIMKPDAWGVIFVNYWALGQIKAALDTAGFKFTDVIVWEKTASNSITPLETAVRFKKAAQVRFKKKPPCRYTNQVASKYRDIEIEGGCFHPCRKPLKLMRRLVKDYSGQNDIVLDPFFGSGTTAIAAALEGRGFAGCDITEEYYLSAVYSLRNYREFA